MKVSSLLVRLGLFAAAMILLLFGVFQTISRPVARDTDTYTATFTDANGLRVGNDVRVYGVRVGKVTAVDLDGTTARVRFTLEHPNHVFTNSKLAIKYQNLTGQRYLDVQQPDKPAGQQDPKNRIDAGRTIPSFDITTLFNGLQPVLATLTPADLNQFATSLLAVVQGDGSQVGSALDAIQKLTDHYTKDRQAVISTLVHNLAQVADQLGGTSGNAVSLLTSLTTIFQNLQQKTVSLVDYMLTIPPLIEPVRRLLGTLELDKVPNPELDDLLRTAIPDPHQIVDVLNRVPSVLQTLTAMVPADANGVALGCSHGAAAAPQPIGLLIAGQRISLCNR
ncbi:MlaD family protein [Nocardia sp. NPDC059228]|uniref:MlaD family protein n=1 Tax=Nocardia sp. NPDC059228 TaxID=3346777 RepID=UPI0036738234